MGKTPEGASNDGSRQSLVGDSLNRKLQSCRAGRVRMNWGHWRPGTGLDTPPGLGVGGADSGWGVGDWRATLKGLNRLLLLMNLFAWAQDWRASHLYPVYTRIRFIILPCFFCYV